LPHGLYPAGRRAALVFAFLFFVVLFFAVLFFALESMRDAGIGEVGIIVGDTQAEIRAAVGDGSSFGLAVTYIPQDAPRGLAHAVLISEAFLAGEPFVMYLGDNLLQGGIEELVAAFRASQPDALSGDAPDVAGALVTPEHIGQVACRDAHAGVGDLDDHLARGLVRLERHPAAVLVELDGVGHQVEQDLAEADCIGTVGVEEVFAACLRALS